MPKTGHNKKPCLRSQSERDQLVMQWYRLPFYVVKQMAAKYSFVNDMGLEDAAQVGLLAMVRAAELWDPKQKIKFNTYAYSAIFRRVYKEAVESGLLRVPICAFNAGQKRFTWKQPTNEMERLSGIVTEDEPAAKSEVDIEVQEMAERALKTLRRRERMVIRRYCMNGETGGRIANRMKPPVSKTLVYDIRDQALVKLQTFAKESGWAE